MRSCVRIAVTILLCGCLVTTLGQDNETRTGFAIITLVSGNIAGLLAAETLIYETDVGVSQTIVAPSVLVTSASMLVTIGESSEETTGIALSNPSDGSGGVNLLLTDQQGRTVFNRVITLGPRGHFAKFLNELFPVPPTGAPAPRLLTISAEIPVGIAGLNFRGGDFASVPLTSLASPTPLPFLARPSAATASIGGAGALFFPQVATGGGWSTEISIGNTSSAPQTIRIDFFGPNGVILGSLPRVTIAPRGVFLFSTEPN